MDFSGLSSKNARRINILEHENEELKLRIEVLEEEVKIILRCLKVMYPSSGPDIDTLHDRLVARAKSQG